MTDMVTLDGLTKAFGSLLAVDDISMSVGRGEVLGFLGPNGAGKSTTMKMVAGYLTPTAGTAVVCGQDVTRNPVAVKAAIGYLPEGAPTYGDMTVEAFLDFVARIRGFDGAEKARRVAEAVDKVTLHEVLHQSIETLSKGFKRRVGLAQSILHDPEVLILDEPTDGLDPNQKQHVRSLISEMAKDKAIIISTHILEEVEAVCTRAVIIAHGKLLADGTPDDLLARSLSHNAVLIKLDKAAADALAPDLRSLNGVDSVETSESSGVTQLTVLPKDGGSIAVAVSDLVRAKNVDTHELFVDKGTLDDVFRRITQETPAGPAADATDGEGAAHA